MKMRRSALAVAVATSLTITAIPAAQAQDVQSPAAEKGASTSAQQGASSSSSGNDRAQGESAQGSSEYDNETWATMHPALKVFIGFVGAAAGATALVTALGVFRTIVFNLFHV